MFTYSPVEEAGADAAPLFWRYGSAARTPGTRSKGFYWAGLASERAGDRNEANRAVNHFEHALQLDPVCPDMCVRCLSESIDHRRPMTFRRADRTVERVVAVQWPYCENCYPVLKPLDDAQRLQGASVFAQMVLVAYGVGAAMDLYDFWFPSLLLFIPLIFSYGRAAKNTRAQ